MLLTGIWIFHTFSHLGSQALGFRSWQHVWQVATGKLNANYHPLTGKPLGTMAKLRPFWSTERSSDVWTCSDLLTTQLALSGVVSTWSFCVVLACLASTSFENFVWCLLFVSAKTRPCPRSRKAVTPRLIVSACAGFPRVYIPFLTKSCSNLAIVKVHWWMRISNKVLSALCRVVSALVPFTTELSCMLRGMMSARKHLMLEMWWFFHCASFSIVFSAAQRFFGTSRLCCHTIAAWKLLLDPVDMIVHEIDTLSRRINLIRLMKWPW